MNPEILKRKLPTQPGKRAAFMILAAFLLALPLEAQQSGSTTSSDQPASASDQQIPPAIAKELAAMRQRIEQLEAELRKHQESEQPTTVVQSAKATAPVSTPAIAPVMAAVEPGSSALPAAATGKKEKAEPFAFADFTWLNGNSRVREVPFDT
ncbi:MAG TPA: hypothetical protein VEF05_17915, partial [Terriglobales bacterium]|nr:hypothetical protein [Terriglobales bacterium]